MSECSLVEKNLDTLFKPKAVAVIGASSNEAKIGYQILNNLVVGGYAGELYPINPKEEEILGKKAYKSVLDVPGDIDLAVISIPANYAVEAMEECAKKGIGSVAMITSGFSEVGNHEAEQKLKQIADENGIALLGPNILGLVYVPTGLNASFGPRELAKGNVAFISQSGALAIALMGWTVMEKIGLSALVSIGNKADIAEEELIKYFNQDQNVNAILIYMEGVKDGKKFMATKVEKPVVVLKVGCTARGAKAAASHTGSLAGSDKVFDAAFKQLGMLRAKTFNEAFGWSLALSMPEPKGKETLIITNGGGIGVRATDECEEFGISILDDAQWLEEKFRSTMPSFGSTKNPIDITGGSGVGGYQKSLATALKEDRIHSVIVLYCETVITDPMDIAKTIKEEYDKINDSKPVVVAIVGGERSRNAIHYLNDHNIPAFNGVKEAISALKVAYHWKEISHREKDNPSVEEAPQEAKDIIQRAKAQGRDALLEHEARDVMEICGVPMPKAAFAKDLDEVLEKSQELYPVAMKISSPDIIHKTDVGGVVINIRNDEEMKVKYDEMMKSIKQKAPNAKILGVNLVQMVEGIECIVGLSRDPQFGPVVMFGIGGVFVEALKDVSFRIIPFGEVEAGRLVQDIKAQDILNGFRGYSVDKPTIIKTLCAIQKLAPLVKEVDINPLISNKKGSYAVDARIIL